MDVLVAALTRYAQNYFASAEAALVTRERHRRALGGHRGGAWSGVGRQGRRAARSMIAEELRAAATALGRLTGRVDVEDILDVIFRDFCIGK